MFKSTKTYIPVFDDEVIVDVLCHDEDSYEDLTAVLIQAIDKGLM